MRAYRPGKWAARGALASIIVVALTGCGGGGGDSTVATPSPTPPPTNPTPPPTTVTVASVKFPATSGIAIVGTAKTIPVTVIGSDGKVMTGKTISWASSDATKATVEAGGVVSPLAAGAVAITATVDGIVASMNLAVSDAPADLAAFKALFPNSAGSDASFKVASEITQAYSDAQLAHLQKSWNFFEGFFPRKPGNYTQMYYAWDRKLVEYAQATLPECSSSALAELPGRVLVTCRDGGTLTWIVAPHAASDGSIPGDTATNLASVGQSFMDMIKTSDIFTWPWLWEGFSFAIKAGSFDAGGKYTMSDLGDPERTAFKEALASNPTTLLPLSGTPATDLVELTRTRTATGTWFGQEAVATPQASMLINYLFRTYPTLIENLFAEIDAGTTVTTSQAAFDYLLNGTPWTVDELETEYKKFGAAQ